MQKVNLTDLKKVLPFFWKEKKPLYLWGKPSTGKTSMIRQFAKKKAKELGLEYSEYKFGPEYFTMKVITMSQYDAADLRGMPEISEENGQRMTRFLPTEELPREGQGIIFFDEMAHADETIRASTYNYILEDRLSNLPPLYDEEKKPKFLKIAASNTEKDYSGVQQTHLAQLSRFAHYEVEPHFEENIQYFLENNDDSRIIAYLHENREDLFPKVHDERLLDQKANPFPRQWENASHMIKGIKDRNLLHLLVAGCVGSEVAAKFVAFCQLVGKISLARLIENPKAEMEKINKEEESASLTWSAISNLAGMWYNKDKKLPPVKVIEIAECLPPEFASAFLKLVLRKRYTTLTKLSQMDPLLEKLGIYFDE